MSDIEVLKVIKPDSSKKKELKITPKGKRKRTSSGLIEQSNTLKGTETVFEEFVIDRTITPQRKLKVEDVELSEKSLSTTSEWRKQLEKTLLGSQAALGDTEPDKKRKKLSCFNCDGEHSLKDCPRSKNFRRISKNKEEFLNSRPRFSEHRGISKQKNNHFIPGVLSDKLRDALGLQDNDIPEHVYRMRKLGFIKGYPPGWLKKAIKSTDMLKFYTSEDVNKKDEEERKPPELDSSKIFWYAGFNDDRSQKGLNDRENFRIPPKNVFCDVYQEELVKIFKNEKISEKTKKTPKRKTFVNESDDEVIFIDTQKTTDQFATPGEEDVVVVLDEKVNLEEKSLETPKKKNVNMGESMFEIVGTPVFGDHSLTALPSLEAFAVGIQPFEAKNEETNHKGNYKKLMDQLKEIRNENLELIIPQNPVSTTIEGKEETRFTPSKIELKKITRKEKRKVRMNLKREEAKKLI